MTRAPAHPGAAPRPLQFRELGGATAARLREITGAVWVERAEHPTPAPAGYYRLGGGSLPAPVFAKVLTPAQMARETPASALADDAARANLPTLHTMGAPVALDDTHHVLCWPWVEAQFSVGKPVELAHLGAALRQLHAFLRLHATSAWQARGRRVLDITWANLEQLAQTTERETHLFRALQQLLQNRSQFETLLLAEAQPVHDDLHRGNVLFNAHGQVTAFLDFEEALDAFASPWLDLSWVVERFCVGPDTATTRQNTTHFLQAYRPEGFNEPLQITNQRLELFGLWRNLRALALLHKMPVHPPHWHEEWEKFSQVVQRYPTNYSLRPLILRKSTK